MQWIARVTSKRNIGSTTGPSNCDVDSQTKSSLSVEDLIGICIDLLPREATLCQQLLVTLQESGTLNKRFCGCSEEADIHAIISDYLDFLPEEYDRAATIEAQQSLKEKSKQRAAESPDLRDAADPGKTNAQKCGDLHHSQEGSDNLDPSKGDTEDCHGSVRKLPWIPDASVGNMRARVFHMLEEERSSKAGKIIAWSGIIIIAVCTLSFVIESLPRFKHTPKECGRLQVAGLPLTVKACEPESDKVFFHIDAVCIIIFTIDYMLRLCLVHADVPVDGNGARRTLRYASEALNIIDLVAILPFYIELTFPEAPLGFIRVLRLARVLRPFKMAKHNPGIQMFAEVLKMSGQPLLVLLAFNIMVIVFFGSLVFFAESGTFSVDPQFTESFPKGVYVRADAQSTGEEISPFRSIPYSFWFVCVTMTTVGYGDYSPTTAVGKAVTVAIFYVGILFIAFPLGVLSSNFNLVYAKYNKAAIEKRDRVSVRRSAGFAARRRGSMSFDGPTWFPVGGGLRRRIFLTFHHGGSCRLARTLQVGMIIAIFASIAAFILETMPEVSHIPSECMPSHVNVEDCEPRPAPALAYVETVCVVLFTVDYVIRMVLSHSCQPHEAGIQTLKGQDMPAYEVSLRYVVDPLNIVDFLAIIPFYIELVAESGSSVLEVLRIVRLARLLRLLRTPTIRHCADLFTNVILDAMPAIFTLLFTTLLMCILLASCMVFAERSLYSLDVDGHPTGAYIRPAADGYGTEVSPYSSIPYATWWFFVTSTTVGYGDDYPTTTMGRFIAVCTFYLGIVLLALPLTIVGQSFQKFYPQWVKEFYGSGEECPLKKFGAAPSEMAPDTNLIHVSSVAWE